MSNYTKTISLDNDVISSINQAIGKNIENIDDDVLYLLDEKSPIETEEYQLFTFKEPFDDGCSMIITLNCIPQKDGEYVAQIVYEFNNSDGEVIYTENCNYNAINGTSYVCSYLDNNYYLNIAGDETETIA